jgi:hypothetical protein
MHTHTPTHAHTRTHARTRARAPTPTHTHARTHAHTHTQAQPHCTHMPSRGTTRRSGRRRAQAMSRRACARSKRRSGCAGGTPLQAGRAKIMHASRRSPDRRRDRAVQSTTNRHRDGLAEVQHEYEAQIDGLIARIDALEPRPSVRRAPPEEAEDPCALPPVPLAGALPRPPTLPLHARAAVGARPQHAQGRGRRAAAAVARLHQVHPLGLP